MKLIQPSVLSRREKALCIIAVAFLSILMGALNPFRSLDHGIEKHLFEERGKSQRFSDYFVNSLHRFSYFRTDRNAPRAPIDLVLIDDSSLKSLNLEWPLPRSIYADILERIEKCEPRAIGIDIIFSEKSPKPENDLKFARCLRKYDNVILGSLTADDPATGGLKVANPAPCLIEGWTERQMQERIGFVDSGIQDPSGIIRRAHLIYSQGGSIYYSFDALLLARYLGVPINRISDRASEGFQQIGPITVPVQENSMWINYISKESVFSHNVYQAYDLAFVMDDRNEARIRALMKDHIVILGVSATQAFEVKECPLGTITGPEIHVNIITTVLFQKFLRETQGLMKFLVLFLPAFLLILLLPLLSPGAGTAVYFILNYLVYLHTTFDFMGNGVFNPTSSSLVLLFLTYGTLMIITYTKTYRSRRNLKNLLLELAPVPEPVLERIVGRDGGQVRLGGEKVELTVLFSDIRGYTSLSQNLDPREVMDTLNEYFTATGSIYKKNGGMVFDTMGDGQMLVFGADEDPNVNHAYMAVKAAMEVFDALDGLNRRWEAQNRQPVRIGIGINTGPVSLGFLGSRGSGTHKQYAAIGDTTNVAARIESLTKDLHAPIIISESTYEKAKDLIDAEPLPATKVKGKDEAISIYRAKGLKEKRN